jgi:hypothetical protein
MTTYNDQLSHYITDLFAVQDDVQKQDMLICCYRLSVLMDRSTSCLSTPKNPDTPILLLGDK